MECSGNSGFEWFQGGIGNARWAGVPLATVLEAAGIQKDRIEVVFYGADRGDATVPYIGGLGDRMGEIPMKESFARGMSVPEAMDPANLLCHEMNGAPLRKPNGLARHRRGRRRATGPRRLAHRREEDLLGGQRADHADDPDLTRAGTDSTRRR